MVDGLELKFKVWAMFIILNKLDVGGVKCVEK